MENTKKRKKSSSKVAEANKIFLQIKNGEKVISKQQIGESLFLHSGFSNLTLSSFWVKENEFDIQKSESNNLFQMKEYINLLEKKIHFSNKTIQASLFRPNFSETNHNFYDKLRLCYVFGNFLKQSMDSDQIWVKRKIINYTEFEKYFFNNAFFEFSGDKFDYDLFDPSYFLSFRNINFLAFNHPSLLFEAKYQQKHEISLTKDVGNEKFLFQTPRFQAIDVFPSSLFDSDKLSPILIEDKTLLINNLFKYFGKMMFQLMHSAIFQESIQSIKNAGFCTIQRIMKYFVEPFSLIKTDFEQIHREIGIVLKWIVNQPYLPEMVWLFTPLNKNLSNMNLIQVPLENEKKLDSFWENLLQFGSYSKDEDHFIKDIPSSLIFEFSAPFGLKLYYKPDQHQMIWHSICVPKTEIKDINYVSNHEKGIEKYFRNIVNYYEERSCFKLIRAAFAELLQDLFVISSNEKFKYILSSSIFVQIFKHLIDAKVNITAIKHMPDDYLFQYQNLLKERIFMNEKFPAEKNTRWVTSISQSNNVVKFLQKDGKTEIQQNSWNLQSMSIYLAEHPAEIKISDMLNFLFSKNLHPHNTLSCNTKFIITKNTLNFAEISYAFFFPSAGSQLENQSSTFSKNIFENPKFHSRIEVDLQELYNIERFNIINSFQNKNQESLPNYAKTIDKYVIDYTDAFTEKSNYSLRGTSSLYENLLKFELSYILILIYDSFVYIPPKWKCEIYLKNIRSMKIQLLDLSIKKHGLLPIQWKGGDYFVFLIEKLTNRKSETLRFASEIISSSWFQKWVESQDLTLKIRDARKDQNYVTYYQHEFDESQNRLKKRDALREFNIPYQRDIKIAYGLFLKSNGQILDTDFQKSGIFSELSNQIHSQQSIKFSRNFFPIRFQFYNPDDIALNLGTGIGIAKQFLSLFFDLLTNNVNWKKNANGEKNSIPWMELESIGKLLNYAFIQRLQIPISESPLFWKLVNFGTSNQIELQDEWFLDADKCKAHFITFLMEEKELNDMQLEFSYDENNDFELCTKSLSLWYEKLTTTIGTYFDKDMIFNVKEGFNLTRPDYYPSYKGIYDYFYVPMKVDPDVLIASFAIDSDCEKEEHKNCCFEPHWLSNILCPLWILSQWIKNEATQAELRKFVLFCTGELTFSDKTTIRVCLNSQKDENAQVNSSFYKIPSSRTCFRELTLSYNDVKPKKELSENDYKKNFMNLLKHIFLDGGFLLYGFE